ncbi:MAG: flagellar hook-length control protein FliK [Phreatobacter sp.]
MPAAPAGRIASREAAPPGPPGAPSGGDAAEEKSRPLAPAAAAQAARTGEPARPAEDPATGERKLRGADGEAMTAARHGRSGEARGQDREPVRHDGAAERAGAQTQTQPHPSGAAQMAAPASAAAPGESGLPNQLVPVVSTSGPQMMAAEVIQKVAAQAHAPGASVPIHGLAIAVAARAAAGSTRFDIRLDPPELGRIEVQLILDREGSIRSRMVVEKQETLDLLQRDQRNLERALAQAGLDTKEGGIEFTLRDQGGHDRERPRPEQQLWLSLSGGPQSQTTALPAAEIQSRLAALRGGIDIRI